jgi:hypothetical protein
LRYVCCFVSLTAQVPKAIIVEAPNDESAIDTARRRLAERPDSEWALLFVGDKQVAMVERDPDRDGLE